jgi:hypothetical protein
VRFSCALDHQLFCGTEEIQHMAGCSSKTDVLCLKDGSSMQVARLPEVDDKTWREMKRHFESNSEIVTGLQEYLRDPDAMRSFLQVQALGEHYQTELDSDENGFSARKKILELETDPTTERVFADIKENGMDAVIKYWDDDELLRRINEKVGGIPEVLTVAMTKIGATPLSLHEAAKMGDMRAVAEYLAKNGNLDAHDAEGISPLGYAIGRNHPTVMRALLQASADMYSVDRSGNSALHYAAGYGLTGLLAELLDYGVDVNQANSSGQTPLMISSINKQQLCSEILRGVGAAAPQLAGASA